MRYTATIVDFQFSPMAGITPSLLTITVFINAANTELMLEPIKDSIPSLSKRFGFEIKGEFALDFTGFRRRICLVEKTNTGFRFVQFI